MLSRIVEAGQTLSSDLKVMIICTFVFFTGCRRYIERTHRNTSKKESKKLESFSI